MTPELATEPTITRTAEPPDDLRPVETGHCYRCGFAPCMTEQFRSYDCAIAALPVTLDDWLTHAVGQAMRAVLGDDWPDHPGRRDLSRALGEELVRWPGSY